jgi:hypothetical protein
MLSAQLPKYLYKYRAVDANALAMLASDKLYLSRLDAFNDPFEVLSLDSTLQTALTRDGHGPFAVSRDTSKTATAAERLRVCSLTEESQDLLMWGHYANRHRGFCIRFEMENEPALAELMFPIHYSPTLTNADELDVNSIEDAIQNSLAKSSNWSYEREWRIVAELPVDAASNSELFATYRPEALTAIIFGVRTPELHKALIRRVLAGRRIEYLQAEKQSHDFALAIRSAGNSE